MNLSSVKTSPAPIVASDEAAPGELRACGLDDLPPDVVRHIGARVAENSGLAALESLASHVPAVARAVRDQPGHPLHWARQWAITLYVHEQLRSRQKPLSVMLRELAAQLPSVRELDLIWRKEPSAAAWAAGVGKPLAGATSLRRLSLRGPSFHAGLDTFLSPLRDLGHLRLECFHLDRQYPCAALSRLSRLASLQLIGGRLSEDELESLGQAPGLQALELVNVELPADGCLGASGFARLRTFSGFALSSLENFWPPPACHELESLSLQACRRLSQISLSAGQPERLEVLNLSHCRQMTQLPGWMDAAVSLQELELRGTGVDLDHDTRETDGPVQTLARLPQLRQVNASARILGDHQ